MQTSRKDRRGFERLLYVTAGTRKLKPPASEGLVGSVAAWLRGPAGLVEPVGLNCRDWTSMVQAQRSGDFLLFITVSSRAVYSGTFDPRIVSSAAAHYLRF